MQGNPNRVTKGPQTELLSSQFALKQSTVLCRIVNTFAIKFHDIFVAQLLQFEISILDLANSIYEKLEWR